MIKTDLEILELMRNDARSMCLALTAQINLTKGKLLSIGDNPDRDNRERMLAGLEKELHGHEKMVREIDSMIKLEHENKTGDNKSNIQP